MNKEDNKKERVIEKVEQNAEYFSEKYCENIDLNTLIKSLPLIGGQLDALFAYKGSKIIQERVKLFFAETTKSLENLSDEKISKSFFEGEEGFYTFQRVYEQVIRSEEQEKIGWFKNILINSLKSEYNQTASRERFIRVISDLSVIHIKILKYYWEREDVFAKEHRDSSKSVTSIGAVKQKFQEFKESELEAFCNDLVRYHLLYDCSIGTYNYKSGNYRLTSHAIDFLNFILSAD